MGLSDPYRKGFSKKKAIQNDMVANKNSPRLDANGEQKLVFTPGSKDKFDPDFMRETCTDAQVKDWVDQLIEHHKDHKEVYQPWEMGFIKAMPQRETFSGQQIVLIRRYFDRLIRTTAKKLSNNQAI